MQEKDRIKRVLKSLKSNKFNAILAKNKAEAKKIMLKMISQDVTVGVGDSGTIRQIDIIPGLEKRGTVVIFYG